MRPAAFLYALFGALCWGVAPVFGKLGLQQVHPLDGLIARSFVTLGFLGSWALFSGRLHRLASLSPAGWGYLGLEALFATLVGDLAYYAALKWGSAGGTGVILAASPVVTFALSLALLHESYTSLQLAGVVLVVVGILLVSLGAGGGRSAF